MVFNGSCSLEYSEQVFTYWSILLVPRNPYVLILELGITDTDQWPPRVWDWYEVAIEFVKGGWWGQGLVSVRSWFRRPPEILLLAYWRETGSIEYVNIDSLANHEASFMSTSVGINPDEVEIQDCSNLYFGWRWWHDMGYCTTSVCTYLLMQHASKFCCWWLWRGLMTV